MKVAVYTRVSTEAQAEEGTTSLQEQEDRCRAFAEHKGWEVVEVYCDDGFTGTKAERPEWDRLMADAKAGKFGAVVVYNWKRFARNARVGLNISFELEELGVALAVTELDMDTTTSQGRMFRTQMLGFAEFDRDMVVEQLAKGQYGKARKGGWPGGGVPYGYRQVGQAREARVILDQDEAEMLRRAADLVIDEGLGRDRLADRLNAEGYRQRNGKPWNPGSIKSAVRNPALKGELWWGRTGTGRYGKPVMIQVEPAVLTPERFEELQRARRQTSNKSSAVRPYPLGDQRMSSPCGEVYGGRHRKDCGRMIYRCRRRRSRGVPKCDCPSLHVEPIEERVWSQISDLLDPERLTTLATDHLIQQTSRSDTNERAKLQVRIAKLERSLSETVTEYMRAGLPVDAVQAATDQIKRELDELRVRQAQLGAQAATADLSTLELVERARSRLDTMNRAQQAEVLALLNVQVRVLDTSQQPALEITGSVPWDHPGGDAGAPSRARGTRSGTARGSNRGSRRPPPGVRP